MEKIAILGFGCAGYHCAKTLREEGFQGAIHVYSDTDLPPYNPMLTPYYAGRRLPWRALFPFGSLQSIARSLSLTVHSRLGLRRLDARRREVQLDGGRACRYDAILISTGARSLIPHLPHMPAEHVYGMRTPAEAEALRRRLDQGNVDTAVVVGASLAAMKAAELFRQAGVRCVLTHRAPTLFPLEATPEMGMELARRVEEQGVCLRLGQRLTDLRRTGDRLEVCLEGETLPADLVVLAMGTRPNLDFLDRDGPQVDRGVVVNERMETSAPGIYAAGDCISAPGLSAQAAGLWTGADRQGVMAAEAMLGRPADRPGGPLHSLTQFLGMDFLTLGDVNARGEVLRYHSGDCSLYAVRTGGRLALVNMVDRPIISGAIKGYLARRFQGREDPISPMQRVLLLRGGLSESILRQLEQ